MGKVAAVRLTIGVENKFKTAYFQQNCRERRPRRSEKSNNLYFDGEISMENDNSINADENVPLEESKYDYNSVFSYNDNTENINAERMNRDYLKIIYNDEMKSLNKEVRYTRTQYLREISKAQSEFDNTKKQNKKDFIVAICLLIVLVSAGGYFTYQFFYFYHFARTLFAESVFNSSFDIGNVNLADAVKSCYFACAISGFFSMLFYMIGLISFYILGTSGKNRARINKRTLRRTLDRIEEKKQENMLMGTYDSLG